MKKTNKELRKFAIVMTIGFAVVAAILLLKHKPAWSILAGISAFFLVSGLIVPRILAPIEWAWMKFAYGLGVVMTYILVTLAFYLAITPVGLLLKLMGKDLLVLKRKSENQSYWVDVKPDGPHSRPDKPY